MADFFENEAEVSDNEEEEEQGSGQPTKKKRKVRLESSDDDEDEEDDEEQIRKEMQDFVVEGNEEEEEAAPSEKSGVSDEEEDEDLDDDLDLIQDNLGESAPQRKSRVVIEDDEGVPDDADDRERIAHRIFDEDEEGEEELPELDRDEEERRVIPGEEDRDRESESGGESDLDRDFIAPEPGQEPLRRKTKKGPISNAQLDEAREIFGVDFEYEKFFDVEEEEEAPEEEEDLDEMEDEDEEGERIQRARKKRKAQKSSLLDQMDPAELERGFLSEKDTRIQLEDKPERFQLRRVPITEADRDEMDQEALWIYNNAFRSLGITMSENPDEYSRREQLNQYPKEETKKKIEQALDFIRNHNFEVPFVAFYRKEYVEPELGINDLWKVYQWDEKWCQLQTRKRNLTELFKRMQAFQFEKMALDPDEQLADDVRIIVDEDFIALGIVENMEELNDIVAQFNLYYGPDIPAMEAWEHKSRQEGGEEPHEKMGLKQASRKDAYSICLSAGLAGLAAKFGLTPKQFGENLEEEYSKNEVEQYPVDPIETANDYITRQFPSAEEVLEGAKYMVAKQMSREPQVRAALREQFRKRCMVSVKSTKKGRKEIDENHPVYTKKYLRNKPVGDMEKEEFLKLTQAEAGGLITLRLHCDKKSDHNDDAETDISDVRTFAGEVINKGYYLRDEYSATVQAWNKLRNEALKKAMEKFLYPIFIKEMRVKLLNEAREFIVKECCLKLYNWLKIGPYVPDTQNEDDEEMRFGTRVMSIAYPQERDQASFVAVIDGDGEMMDYMRLVHFTKRMRSRRIEDRNLKEQDMDYLKKLIVRKKPDVIVMGGENLDALFLKEDVEDAIKQIEVDGQIQRRIPVEIIDNEVAKVFMNSKRADAEFKDYPNMLRQAVSIGRRLQDPLTEFCQLCTPDEEILCMNYHPLQDQVIKEDLISALMLEFINRVNEVGVDINRCLDHSHTSPILQFVCGLGPRKAAQLLKVLKQHDNFLENRTKLVTLCRMGPKVFMNCAGFIKIDTTKLAAEKQDAFVELLDGTRVHPETYEWARKMAIDALEVEEDEHAANALEMILDQPEKLKDLDLDAFAEELKRQGFGSKEITLYDIRAELNHRYKDLRQPYRPPQREEIFNLLTKETPQTFNVGKLVMGRVIHVVYKKPTTEQKEQTNPVRDNDTGLWHCPLCLRNDFTELSDVWTHFDAIDGCPGQAVGVKVRLENGITGFIPTKYISDKNVENPNDRVVPNMPVYCRVLKVDTDRFQAELSSRSSDLADREAQFRPPKDQHYDFKTEETERKLEEEEKAKKDKTSYVRRVIAHPAFHNITFKEAEKLLDNMDQGECIIRPSSKGFDHLTVTWKVSDGVYQHIDVREEGKEKPFTLGKSLWIGEEEFEDLDEIIARHIQPMAALVRDISVFKYYMEVERDRETKEVVTEKLEHDKSLNPSRIPYVVAVETKLAGKFLLSYLPRHKVRHEYFSVTPDGFRFRQQVFPTLTALFKWFKEHFRDPIPGQTTTPGITGTPLDNASSYGNAAHTPAMDAMSRVSATPGNPWSGMPPAPMPPMGMNWEPPSYGMPAPHTPFASQFGGDQMGAGPDTGSQRGRATPRSNIGSDWGESARQWAQGNRSMGGGGGGGGGDHSGGGGGSRSGRDRGSERDFDTSSRDYDRGSTGGGGRRSGGNRDRASDRGDYRDREYGSHRDRERERDRGSERNYDDRSSSSYRDKDRGDRGDRSERGDRGDRDRDRNRRSGGRRRPSQWD